MYQDLLTVPDYTLAHYVAQDVRVLKEIVIVFRIKCGWIKELESQNPTVGVGLHLIMEVSTCFICLMRNQHIGTKERG